MKHSIGSTLFLALLAAIIALSAQAADLTVTMHKLTQDGISETLGTITLTNSPAGAALKFALHGLPPGPHGVHIHDNANCDPTLLNGIRIPGGGAGSHFDPDHTAKHEGPTAEGHLGDLPLLVVESNGTATQTLTAPRLKNIDLLKGHALIIHIGGDNYSDSPAILGGGGGRFACGLVE